MNRLRSFVTPNKFTPVLARNPIRMASQQRGAELHEWLVIIPDLPNSEEKRPQLSKLVSCT